MGDDGNTNTLQQKRGRVNTPLLSIAIPTFNRSTYLSELLVNIEETCKNWVDIIEIVVSDNASRDETRDVVSAFKERSNFTVVYHRNTKNVGVSANLIGLYALCSGKYFLFIGDDDRLYRYGMSCLLKLLKGQTHFSAVFQARSDKATPEYPSVAFLAKHYLYKFGNAYNGLVNRELALNAIDKLGGIKELSSIVWPQTAIAFVAMALGIKQQIPPVVLGCELGFSPHHNSLNIVTFEYYKRTLFDLTKAARYIDDFAPHIDARRYIRHTGNDFFPFILNKMLLHAQTEKLNPVMTLELSRTFHHYIGPRGWYLSLQLMVFKSELLIKLYYRWLNRSKSKATINDEIAYIIKIKRQSANTTLKAGVRFENYWDPD